MAVELPKDAKGREIPLDTRRLYDKNGERKTVLWFEYSPTLKHWTVVLSDGPNTATSASAVSHFYLTPPDCWEKIELPKDALGRVIPLDTEVLYDSCGTRVSVKEFISRTLVESQRTGWTIKAQYEDRIDYSSFKPKNMHLTKPDSWKMLEEDLDKCIAESDLCWYYSPSGQCRDCAISDNEECGCTAVVFKDIKKRIRKLRGESDV